VGTQGLGNSEGFSLREVKEDAFKDYAEGAPQRFKKFFNTPLFDRLLHTCVLLFVARFQIEALSKSVDKHNRVKDEDRSSAAEQRIRQLEAEVEHYRAELSPLYGSVLMNYSDYKNPQQDKLFFETFYDVLAAILRSAFASQRNDAVIEVELGLIFRTNHFNLASRVHNPPRSIDTLSLRELHALKTEGSSLSLSAKMFTSLAEKPSPLGVQTASVATSELIGRICARKKVVAPKPKARRAPTTPKIEDVTFEGVNGGEEGEEALPGEQSSTFVAGKDSRRAKNGAGSAGHKMTQNQMNMAALTRRVNELEAMKDSVKAGAGEM
jgi:hypothetical protein